MEEFDIIKKISRLVGGGKPKLLFKGIGDDAAVVWPDGRRFLIFTIDTFNEEIHFRRKFLTPFEAGFKATSGAVSDICAKGGDCTFLLVSISVPKSMGEKFILEFYRGVKTMADYAGSHVVGGDTTRSKRYFSATICAVGYAEKSALKFRSGVRPGDRLWVTGQTGYSLAGLKLLERNLKRKEPPFKKALKRHRLPYPCVGLGRKVLWKKSVHASIDVSDGLSSELHHLALSSGVKLVVREKALVVESALTILADALKISPESLALNSGEEYELLIATDSQFRLKGALQLGWAEAGIPNVFLLGTHGEKPLLRGGWNHFQDGASS